MAYAFLKTPTTQINLLMSTVSINAFRIFSDYFEGAETPDSLLSTLINIELRTAINLQMGESISSSFSFPESIFIGYF